MAESSPYQSKALDLLEHLKCIEDEETSQRARQSFEADQAFQDELEAGITHQALVYEEAGLLAGFIDATAKGVRKSRRIGLSVETHADGRYHNWLGDHRLIGRYVTTAPLLRSQPAPVNGRNLAHGYVFETYSMETINPRARKLISLTMNEVALPMVNGFDGVIDSTEFTFHNCLTWVYKQPFITEREMPKVDDPNASFYWEQIEKLRVARIELGDKSVPEVLK